MVLTKWSNCLLSTDFHGSSQGHVSRQTYFPFLGTSAGLPACLIVRYQITSFGDVKSKVYETHPPNIDYLKQLIQECIQGIPNEILKCVMVSIPSQLQECTEQQGGPLVGVVFKE
jgi:hypothetical protein